MKKNNVVNTILYIIKNAQHQTLGDIKISKFLYLADFEHYKRHGESICDAEYIRLENGPTIDGFKPMLNDMLGDGLISESKKDSKKPKYSANVEPVLPESATIILDELVGKWKSARTSDMVTYVHDQPPYMLTNDYESVPYYLVLSPGDRPGDVFADYSENPKMKVRIDKLIAELESADVI